MNGIGTLLPQEKGLPGFQQGVLLMGGDGQVALYGCGQGAAPAFGIAGEQTAGVQRLALGQRQGQQPPDDVVGG